MPDTKNKLFTHYSLAVRSGIYILFLLAILPGGIYAFRKPHYNWDMLPYMAIVSGMNQQNADSIHKIVYDNLKNNVPADIFNQLYAGGEHRKLMATNPAAFYGQLPFYRVKPLYTGLCSLFYQCGFSLTKATILPSILAFFLIGSLVFYWLLQNNGVIFSFVAALLMMYSGFMISAARGSIPDGLSAFFLLCSFYFIIEKPSVLILFLFLLTSVFVRIDNALNAFLIITFLAFSGKWSKKIRLKNYAIMVLLLGGAFLFVSATSTGPLQGWSFFYYPTFTHYYNSTYTFNPVFSFKDYFALLYSKLIAGMAFTNLSFFVLLAFLIVYKPVSFSVGKMSFPESLCMFILFLAGLRFVLFPDISDRFYIAYYFVIIILFIKKFFSIKPVKEQPAY